MLSVFLTGFISSFVQIVAIGAQNAFVLKNGLAKNHVFASCFICFICDLFLITLSIFGLSDLIAKNKILIKSFKYLGFLFLFYYGFSCLRKSLKSSTLIFEVKKQKQLTLIRILTVGCFVSILNPHAWLDTFIIIGSLSTEYPLKVEKFYFYLGSLTSSLIWFFSIGFLAKFLSKYFKKLIFWKVFDFLTAITMFLLALKLLID